MRLVSKTIPNSGGGPASEELFIEPSDEQATATYISKEREDGGLVPVDGVHGFLVYLSMLEVRLAEEREANLGDGSLLTQLNQITGFILELEATDVVMHEVQRARAHIQALTYNRVA